MPGKGDPWVMSCPHVPHLCPTALPCPTATVCPTGAHCTLMGMGGTLLPHPGHPPCPVPQLEKARDPSGGDLGTGPGMG